MLLYWASDDAINNFGNGMKEDSGGGLADLSVALISVM